MKKCKRFKSIKYETGGITNDITRLWRIVMNFFELLYAEWKTEENIYISGDI